MSFIGTPPTVRRELLRQSADLIERAERHERWDCIAQDYVDQAVILLRQAGLRELADRLEDDAWGGDLRAVTDEVTKLRDGTGPARPG